MGTVSPDRSWRIFCNVGGGGGPEIKGRRGLKNPPHSPIKSDLNAHFSFSSGVPAEVTSMASKNSLKSMKPFLSVSKVRKTWSQNCSAFPDGKKSLYMSTNLGGVKRPFGQSCLNPLYHSLMVFSSYLVCVFKNSKSSWLKPCLLLIQPILDSSQTITYITRDTLNVFKMFICSRF